MERYKTDAEIIEAIILMARNEAFAAEAKLKDPCRQMEHAEYYKGAAAVATKIAELIEQLQAERQPQNVTSQ